MERGQFYKRVKIAGMISFIPVALAAGPLGGFFLGKYLQETFGLAPYILTITISIGLLAGIIETVRIIRLVSKTQGK